LGVPFTTPIELYDNQGVVALAHNPILHARTRIWKMMVFCLRKGFSKALGGLAHFYS